MDFDYIDHNQFLFTRLKTIASSKISGASGMTADLEIDCSINPRVLIKLNR
jgi:hypothetical protein